VTDEFSLIERFFAPLAEGAGGAFALTDDAAVLPPMPGRNLVVTCDGMVEGVHFLATDPAETVGHKVLAVNLSDLAAMGATPLAYVLSIALPRTWMAADLEDWLAGCTAGLGAVQARFGIVLVGGDTVATPGPLSLTVTAFGHVPAGGELCRSGARPGDLIFVSGTIGDAALGLHVLQGATLGLDAEDQARLADRYRRPEPRVALGGHLVGLAHAAVDVSDGLVADLGHICRTSGVAARINTADVPLSPPAARAIDRDPALLAVVLTGGDDYELCFTLPSAAEPALAAIAARSGVAVQRIGLIEDFAAHGTRAAVLLQGPDGAPLVLDRNGYRHF
jgi:thiamine-monophosphate kinase